MNDLLMETGRASVCKKGETLCGDFIVDMRGGDTYTAVLSDGLGSGVKANILATLTAQILARMTAGNMPIDESVDTMAKTLPVCKVRNLAYATFSLVRIRRETEAYLAQYDNPMAVLLRSGVSCDYPSTLRVVSGKEIHESSLELRPGDMLILMSDGVTSAGIGKTVRDGWSRAKVAQFAQEWYTPDISPQLMASAIVSACSDLYLGEPDDDATAFALKLRRRQAANVMIGPPADRSDDERVLRQFFARGGKKVVCGGTTAQTVSRYLNKPVTFLKAEDPEIPAAACIEGVDLVTEGIVTLKRALELAKRYDADGRVAMEIRDKKDAASLLVKLFFEEATDISFFAGQAVNAAHQSGDMERALGVSGHGFEALSVKMGFLRELEQLLQKRGRNVKVTLC